MLDIQEHAYELHKVFSYLEYLEFGIDESYDIPREWLNLAAGVCSVEIVPAMYNSTILMCGTAMDYENRKGDIWSKFTKELTIFNFTWGAMESYIKRICPELYTKKGDIRKNVTIERAKSYLNNRNNIIDVLEYTEVCRKLYYLMDKKISTEIPKDYEDVCYSAKGLVLAKSIRNMFAHGARELPDIDQIEDMRLEDIDLVLDTKMITYATRMVLFTLQFLLIEKYYDLNLIVEMPDIFEFFISDNTDELYLVPILKTLHLKEKNKY